MNAIRESLTFINKYKLFALFLLQIAVEIEAETIADSFLLAVLFEVFPFVILLICVTAFDLFCSRGVWLKRRLPN